jgi:hypothetical protein
MVHAYGMGCEIQHDKYLQTGVQHTPHDSPPAFVVLQFGDIQLEVPYQDHLRICNPAPPLAGPIVAGHQQSRAALHLVSR